MSGQKKTSKNQSETLLSLERYEKILHPERAGGYLQRTLKTQKRICRNGRKIVDVKYSVKGLEVKEIFQEVAKNCDSCREEIRK